MTARRHPRSGAVSLLVAGLGLSLASSLAACSASSNSGSSSGSTADRGAAGGVAPDNGVPAAVPAAPGGDLTQGGAPAAVPTAAVPAGVTSTRDLIYTGDLTIRVVDVQAAADQLAALATASGGYVGSDERTVDQGNATVTITLRVPAAQIGGVVQAASRLGTELHRDLATKDVTAQMIDLNSRILTEQASVVRVRALLAKAQSLSDITTIEGELTRREADLESLQAQQRDLADLVTLSTLTVTLLSPHAVAPKPAKHPTGFVSGLKSGWHAFRGVLNGALTGIGAALPFLIVLGFPLWALIWGLSRRSRRRRGARLALATAGPAPAGLSATPPAGPDPGD